MKCPNTKQFIFLFIFLFLSIILSGCAIFPFHKAEKPKIIEKSAEQKPIWINKVPKEDSDYFYFRGIRTGARTQEDGLTDAKMNAVKQIVEFLGLKGLTLYENLRETFQRGEEVTIRDKIKFEGLGIVKGAKESEQYYEKIEYPEKGKIHYKFDVYIVVTYPREEYEREKIRQREDEEKRRDEEKRKKEEIFTLYKRGMEFLKNGMIVPAIDSLQNSRKKLKEYFPGSAGIEIDSKNKIDMAVIETEIKNIIQKIELEPANERIVYTINGEIIKKPTVHVNYIDGTEKKPVSNLPIKVSFVKGAGRISNYTLKTKRAGDIQIPVENVVVSQEGITIQPEMDIESIGLEKEFIPAPYCRISIDKPRSMAYSINLFSSGRRIYSQSLVNSVKSILVESGYYVIEVNIGKQEVSRQDIEKLNLNVDYLLVISADTHGDEIEGMYYSNATAKLSIYSLLENSWVSVTDVPPARGYGTSPSNSALDAIGKTWSASKDELITRIKELK